MASDAELRMMMMMNTMDLEQEGPMSSEDRLFMGTQQGLRTHQQSQVRLEVKVTMSSVSCALLLRSIHSEE